MTGRPSVFPYSTPGIKFEHLKNIEHQFRKYELRRGHSVRVEYQDSENGVVLVCIATHRKCPYHVATERIAPTQAAPAGSWRTRDAPFCVTHNHPPLFPVPTAHHAPLPAPTNPKPFSDFIYSISPDLAEYLPRLAEQGLDEDYRPAALGDLKDEDLDQLLREAGMTLYERQAVLVALRRGLEKRASDMRALDLQPETDDDDDYYVEGDFVDPLWEDWVAETMKRAEADRKSKAGPPPSSTSRAPPP